MTLNREELEWLQLAIEDNNKYHVAVDNDCISIDECIDEENDEWEYVKAAVEGSSFYKLPKPLQWMTGNIGYHHVHHLSPRVPNYKLEEAHKNTAPLQNVPTVTLMTSLKSLKFRLWDEEGKRFVTFKDSRKTAAMNSRAIQ